MDKDTKAAIALIVLSNLAMLDAFVAVQPALLEEQSRDLLIALERVKKANQDLMKLGGYNVPKERKP
jgi:hypothetical protein